MLESEKKRTLKTLVIDTIMGIFFLYLLYIALWIAWVYYFRGPIDIVTSQEDLQSDQDLLNQAREEYTTHFHNLDIAVVNGIQSDSLCLDCHGDYSHSLNEKMRSMLNAHSWFIACEVCHSPVTEEMKIGYRWIDSETGQALTQLDGTPGNYGALIIPFTLASGTAKRLDENEEYEFTREYLQTRELLDKEQQEAAEERIHETMAETAVSCENCHTEDSLFDYVELLYPPQRALHLQSIDMGAMAKAYEEFFFPNIFDP